MQEEYNIANYNVTINIEHITHYNETRKVKVLLIIIVFNSVIQLHVSWKMSLIKAV